MFSFEFCIVYWFCFFSFLWYFLFFCVLLMCLCSVCTNTFFYYSQVCIGSNCINKVETIFIMIQLHSSYSASSLSSKFLWIRTCIHTLGKIFVSLSRHLLHVSPQSLASMVHHLDRLTWHLLTHFLQRNKMIFHQ